MRVVGNEVNHVRHSRRKSLGRELQLASKMIAKIAAPVWKRPKVLIEPMLA
jgi:hypothetical protein